MAQKRLEQRNEDRQGNGLRERPGAHGPEAFDEFEHLGRGRLLHLPGAELATIDELQSGYDERRGVHRSPS